MKAPKVAGAKARAVARYLVGAGALEVVPESARSARLFIPGWHIEVGGREVARGRTMRQAIRELDLPNTGSALVMCSDPEVEEALVICRLADWANRKVIS